MPQTSKLVHSCKESTLRRFLTTSQVFGWTPGGAAPGRPPRWAAGARARAGPCGTPPAGRRPARPRPRRAPRGRSACRPPSTRAPPAPPPGPRPGPARPRQGARPGSQLHGGPVSSRQGRSGAGGGAAGRRAARMPRVLRPAGRAGGGREWESTMRAAHAAPAAAGPGADEAGAWREGQRLVKG